MIDPPDPVRNRLTDDDGRTRLWVLLLSSLLIIWCAVIYVCIAIGIPFFKELFAGFGGELPLLTVLVLQYARFSILLVPVSVIPLVSLWRHRALGASGNARDFERVIFAFASSLAVAIITAYGLYQPIRYMGAVVS